MPDFAATLGASKAASTLLVLFIPSKDRSNVRIDQAYWVGEALRVLGTLFGGATAFPQGRGSGAMTRRTARCSSMSPSSSSATPASRPWSSTPRPGVTFCTAWDVRRGKERSGW